MNEMIKRKDELSCNMCGKCCKSFFLDEDVHERQYEHDPKYDNWVHNYVKRHAENPSAEMPWLRHNIQEELKFQGKALYYCTALVDSKCSIYEERPATCSHYPFYGAEVQSLTFLINQADCGYTEITHKEK